MLNQYLLHSLGTCFRWWKIDRLERAMLAVSTLYSLSAGPEKAPFTRNVEPKTSYPSRKREFSIISAIV